MPVPISLAGLAPSSDYELSVVEPNEESKYSSSTLNRDELSVISEEEEKNV